VTPGQETTAPKHPGHHTPKELTTNGTFPLGGGGGTRRADEWSLTNTEFVNMVTAKTLEPTWQGPVDVLQNAEAYVDETGEHRRSPDQPPAPTTSRAEPVPPDRSTDRPRSIDDSRRLTGNKRPARVVAASPTRELRP
jgi:hypothetical protein